MPYTYVNKKRPGSTNGYRCGYFIVHVQCPNVYHSLGEFSAPVVGGIVGGVSAFFVITGVIVLLVFGCKAWEGWFVYYYLWKYINP